MCSIELERPETECANTRPGLTLNRPLLDWRAAVQSTETKTCDYCGRVYARNPKWSRAHFEARTRCSRNCPGIVRPDVRTDYVITETGCWEWQGHIDANGY